MKKFISYDDLMDTLEPCEDVDCHECPFYIPDEKDCKWDQFINSLPKQLSYFEGYKKGYIDAGIDSIKGSIKDIKLNLEIPEEIEKRIRAKMESE